MKKILFSMIILFMGAFQANAQNVTLTVEDVDVPEKGQAEIVVNYNTGGKILKGYGFTMKLPTGLSFVIDEATGGPKAELVNGKGFVLTYLDGNFGFLPSGPTSSVSAESGTLLKLTIQADETLKNGESFKVDVTDIIVTDDKLAEIAVPQTSFTINIIENRITLDEESTTAPKAAENVNVLVKRKIKAGNWNTICLPFAMTGDQLKKAFGDDVEFADFTGYNASYDEDDFVTSIKVTFNSVDVSGGILANHPYIIKVGSNKDEFKVDNVNIIVQEEPKVHFGTRTKYKDFIGTYIVINNLGEPAEPCLFLSGNKFYYATGNTKLKAFRGYFAFWEFLKEFDPEASAKFSISVDGEATSIDGIGMQRIVEGVYDLSGRKIQLENGDLNKLQKGVYIIDGKKVTIK